MYNFGNRSCVTNGLIYCVDPMNPKCYNGSGANIYDISGNNVITTMAGDNLAYSNDRSFFFNNSNTNIIQSNCNAILTDFTVCIAFKNSATPQYGRLVDKSYTTGFWLGRNNMVANSWGGGILETASPYGIYLTLTDGLWHYLVSVRNGTTHTLYGDGVSNTVSNTVSSAPTDATTISIGQWSNGSGNSQYFRGNIGIFQLYNRALDIDEILQNYNGIKNRYTIE